MVTTKAEAEKRLEKRLTDAAPARIAKAQKTIERAIEESDKISTVVRLVGVTARDVETIAEIYRNAGWTVGVLGVDDDLPFGALQDTVFFRVS